MSLLYLPTKSIWNCFQNKGILKHRSESLATNFSTKCARLNECMGVCLCPIRKSFSCHIPKKKCYCDLQFLAQIHQAKKKWIQTIYIVLNNPGQFGLFILALFLQFDTNWCCFTLFFPPSPAWPASGPNIVEFGTSETRILNRIPISEYHYP